MIRALRFLPAIATLLVVNMGNARPAEATPIQLFSPAALSLVDVTYNYPARTVAGTQPVITSPLVLTGPGNVLTFTEAGGAMVRMDQEPSVPSAGGWFGTFASGTRLLYTGNNADPSWFGPITINFAAALSEFGLFAQFSDEFFSGPFLFTVFNGATPLSTFSAGVTSFPSFLGARSTDLGFTSLLIRGPSFSRADNDFAIGPITIQTVPEPSTLALLGGGVATIVYGRRRRDARAREQSPVGTSLV
jgi:hypothetical protein